MTTGSTSTGLTSTHSRGAGEQVRPTASGTAEHYLADQLVVASGYEDVVIKALLDLGAAPSRIERDSRLRLSLLDLDATAALAGLQRNARDESPGGPIATALAAGVEAAAEGGYEVSALDLTMRGLRAGFAHRFAGWSPTIGKNRVLGHVTGQYVIDGGGGSTPGPLPGSYVIDGGGGGRPLDLGTDGSASRVVPRDTRSTNGARIGLVDTRLYPHPWLTGGYTTAPRNTLELRPDVAWQAGHATFITGLLLRQAPDAVVLHRGGLDDQATADSWTIARTIADLSDSGAQLVNLSLGCYTDDGQPPLVLTAALNSLGPDVLVVVAAGNHGAVAGGRRPLWPAACDDVVAVGAVDASLATTAQFSPDVQWIDALAQGVDVVSTYPYGDFAGAGSFDNGFARWEGTSFAAAAVTGEIAAHLEPGVRGAREAWDRVRAESKTIEVDGVERPVIQLRSLGTPWD